MNAELTRRATIDQIVGTFEKAEARVRAAFAEIVSAQNDINTELQVHERCVRVDASGFGYHDDFTDADRAVERMARDVWGLVIERLELRRLLSVTRWNQLEARLANEREKLPPLTRAEVEIFASFYADHLGDMVEESIAEVYDLLRPRDWTDTGKLKTNQHDGAVPRKVILSGMVEKQYLTDHARVRYGRCQQELVALQNVFSGLDGKGHIQKVYESPLQSALEAAPIGTRVETEYFIARGYLNGRLHIVANDEQGIADVLFAIADRRVRLRVPLPKFGPKDFRLDGRGLQRSEARRREAWEQACRERWRLVVLLVKAKLEAVGAGATTIEREFLADIFTADGRTVYEAIVEPMREMYADGKVRPLMLGPGGA